MGGKNRIKTLVSMAIMAVVILNITMTASATPNEEVIKTQEKYTELTGNINTAQGEVYRLNTEIDKITEAIKKNEEELKVVSADVEKSKKEIEKAQKDLIKQEETLSTRLRELYKSGGQNNYIVMIATSDGITDLISKIFATSKIVELDKKVMGELKTEQEKLEASIIELEEKGNNIIKVTEENKKALEELQKKKTEQEKIVAQILANQGKFDLEYLAGGELRLVEPQLKILRESNSLEELHSIIGQLISIRDKQLKSSTVIQEINKSITDATKRVEGLEAYIKDKGTVISEGTLSGISIVSYAYQFLGKPYVTGGNGPNEFDCSGFTRYVYNNAVGIDITRTTYTQINQGQSVSLAELQLGDLVFTYGLDHVGIYVGGGNYIHSPQPGESIKVSQIASFTEGRRIIK